MKRVTVNLSDETGENLATLANAQKRTVSAEAAVAIEGHIETNNLKLALSRKHPRRRKQN